MRLLRYTLFTLILLSGFSCTKEKDDAVSSSPSENKSGQRISTAVASVFFEDFETGSKTSYASADVTLGTGTWTLNDALLGTSASDPKNGLQSVRMRNSGTLSMKFDHATGAGTVTILHAKYGSDVNGTWQLWYSTNGGSSYIQTGSTVSTTASALQTVSFTINVSGNIRFQIRKTDAGTNRINFDDFSISDYSISNPVPSLSSISPSSATAGGATFTLNVTGSNFINGSVVNWNGTALTTTFTSSTQLSASVPSANIATA